MEKKIAIRGIKKSKQSGLYFYRALVVVVMFFCCAPVIVNAAPKLTVDMDIATAGYYRLTWSVDKAQAGAVFVLQEAITSRFENPQITYRGPDLATVISGKSDGMYYYRVRRTQPNESEEISSDAVKPEGVMSEEAMWSEVVRVDVQHHSLSKAVGFFIAGLIVFAATLFMIVNGARKSND
ncbi:hypothetical protein [Kaarinaea lacus]